VHLARLSTDHRRLLARVVGECLLADAVHLTHHQVDPAPPRRVQRAELAVLVRLLLAALL
jgi:hypothetical protein